MSCQHRISNCDDEKLFRSFRFHKGIATNPIERDGLPRILGSGKIPPLDRYIVPAAPNNMEVDRVCVACGPGTQNLNTTVLEVKKKLPTCHVLCVVQVVAADDETVQSLLSEAEFPHPHILVRYAELRKFYGATFGTPLEYALGRTAAA